MTLRNGHGNGRGTPRVEVLPVDELPEGVAAASGTPDPVKPEVARRPNGTLADPSAAAELGRLGGLRRAERARHVRILQGLGLRDVEPSILAPYLEDAEQFVAVEMARLARTVGGGVCEGAPATFVQSGALQLAGSRAAFAAGDLALGSRLADASRQNLLAAFELCAREAQSRPKAAHSAAVAAILAAGEERR